MARKQEPNSVATIVDLLLVDSEVKIKKKSRASVAVIVSDIKIKKKQNEKKVKINKI